MSERYEVTTNAQGFWHVTDWRDGVLVARGRCTSQSRAAQVADATVRAIRQAEGDGSTAVGSEGGAA